MAKKQPDEVPAIGGRGATPSAMSLSELKALREEQRELSRRIEEIKLRLFQMTERNVDQTVRLIKAWVHDSDKK